MKDIKREWNQKKIYIERFVEIFYEMSWDSDDYEAYLDAQTGKIIYINPEEEEYDSNSEQEYGEDDPDMLETFQYEENVRNDYSRYLQIPSIEPWIPYNIMKTFVDNIDDPRLQQKLNNAIQGKGAFRRFEDVLFNYPEWEVKWLSYRDKKQSEYVKSWLEEEGFEVLEPQD
ncbi:MAG: hypothetical protein GF383_10305 [Candidatus Lokiarchaeota archaeon]|nr:hypothetical protein [Candidatus Lokiarchaeota archaeon]